MKTLIALSAIIILCLTTSIWAHPPDPTPTLGADCGAAATIVGNESAGKVTLDPNYPGPGCTLGFTIQVACVGTDETNCGRGYGVAIGIVTTPTSARLDFVNTGCGGDVVSYVCNPF